MGKRLDQELDSSETEVWREGAMDGNGKSGWGNSCFSNVFNSFPNDDPVLSSVVDLWVFYWGV